MDNAKTTKELYGINLRRGNILSNFSIIERLVSEVIAAHYTNDITKAEKMILDIFEDEYFSFGTKMNIFKKVIKENYPNESIFYNKLHNLNKLRNLVAHGSIIVMKNSKSDIGQIILSHNNQQYPDPHKKLDEYTALTEEIRPELEKLANKLGFFSEWHN